MKKIKSIFLTAIFASIVLTTNNSCESKCDTLLLCDLAFSTASILEPQITAGAKLVLNNVITNLASECEREKAAESEKKTNAYFRDDQNSPWEQVQFSNQGDTYYDVIIPTQALNMGEKEEREEQYNFTVEGQYKFSLETDTFNAVNEENEDNNGADSNTGAISGKSNQKQTLIVTVVDPTGNGKFKHKVGEPVIIEYLGSKLIGKY